MITGNILADIVEATRHNVAARKRAKPLADLAATIEGLPPRRLFGNALRGDSIRLIAEIKRASPSKGPLAPALDVTATARSYATGGAAAISVLTEATFFKGSFDDLTEARRAVDQPLLCKDFIIDDYQIYEAAIHGADAVLLIVAILDPATLKTLRQTARRLGLAALVEVHNESDVRKALDAGADLIGINNRNLANFTVALETTEHLKPLLPPHITVVSESGIRSAEDAVRLAQAGVHAILVGEVLVTSPDPAAKIRELTATACPPCPGTKAG